MNYFRKLTLLVLPVLLAACGGQPASTADAVIEPNLTIESLTEAEVTIENPDWMVVAEDNIWMLSDPEIDDELSVFALKGIDPTTNQVAFTVDRKKSGCDGLGVADGSVWVCDDQELLRVDPGTGQVAGSIPFAMSWDQGPLPSDNRGLWLLSRAGTELVHIDFAGTELGTVKLPGACAQVTLFEASLYVACPELGLVTVVDSATYAATNEVEVADASVLAAGRDRVWLGFPHEFGGVGWIASDGQLGKVEHSPDISLGCLLVDNDSVWIRGTDIPLVRLDAASGTVVETFESERKIAGGCVANAGGSLWIGSLPFSKVWRLDLAN